MKKINGLVLIFILGIFISGCENSNIFSWTHARGKNKSTDALLADAEKALIDEKYDDAIEYYDEILDKDPDNSEALYGKASAELKNAGLDIADLIPKLLNQDEAAAEDLIQNINLSDLENGTQAAIDALKEIADGKADGTIPADSFDVNLNLGIAMTLHAASSLLNWAESSGAVEIDANYNIEVDTSSVTTADMISNLEDTVEEIEEALTYIEKAAKTSGTDVKDIKDGFEELINNLNAELDKLK